MSVFEPAVARELLCLSFEPSKRAEFCKKWDEAVTKRATAWKSAEDARVARLKGNKSGNATDPSNSLSEAQLTWTAHVVEYVNYVNNATRVHGNSKSVTAKYLSNTVPIFGPRFVPPAPTVVHARRNTALAPDLWYLRPVNVIHAFYYPSIRRCPRCKSTDKSTVSWDSWTSGAPRRVHGIFAEELAIGQQLRCKACNSTSGSQSCFSTTGEAFWESLPHYRIPAGVPVFSHRCALTRDLYDLIIEQRPTSTASGLASAIKQLHMLQYLRDKDEYIQLQYQKFCRQDLSSFVGAAPRAPAPFSAPDDPSGYALAHISSDVITDLYLTFVKNTRQPESERYLRSLSGVAVSIDNTFKITNKATIATANGSQRLQVLKGGLLSILNERGETILWRFCQTKSNKELEEALEGLKRRVELLDAPALEILTADNCCHVRPSVQKVLPSTDVVLDVWHFVMRYLDKMLNGKKNPFRSEIANDITESILKTRADKRKNILSEYWPCSEQIRRLEAICARVDTCQTHQDQLRHVRNGCLARARSDIASDGSRIESSHKHWNSIMRSFSSGIEGLTARAHDFVQRRNISVAISSKSASPFVSSTFGSHHVEFVDSIAAQWNLIVSSLRRRGSAADSIESPRLLAADSGESFGLVWAEYVSIPGVVKQEISLECPSIDSLDDIGHDASAAAPGNPQVIDLTPSEIDKTPLHHAARHIPELARASSAIPTAELATASLHGPPIQPTVSHVQPAQQSSQVISRPNRDTPTSNTASKRASSPTQDNDRAAKAPRTGARNAAVGSLAPIFTRRPSNNAIRAPSSSVTLPAAASTPPAAPVSEQLRLTASERLFMGATGVNPLALRIEKDEEFFLFAELRVELKLRTYEMTPKKIGEITQIYNSRLGKRNIAAVKKDPRALMATLSSLEQQALERRATQNFASASGSVTFWTNQCSFEIGKTPDPGDKRKASVCQRCMKLRYPNGPGKSPAGSTPNHARDCCCDGVHPSLKDEAPWPQPEGLFTMGKHFHIAVFINEVRRLHDDLSRGAELSPAQRSFLKMFTARLHIIEPTATEPHRTLYFRLLSSDKAAPVPAQSDLLCSLDGQPHLRIGQIPHADPAAGPTHA